MKTASGCTSAGEHPIFNTTNFVLIALVQVFVVVMSTLAAGLTHKLFEGLPLPLATVFFVHFGFLILLIPFCWVSAAVWVCIHSHNSEERLAAAFTIGVLLLLLFCCLGGYAVFRPWGSVHCTIGSAL